jgi:hypothetical protein
MNKLFVDGRAYFTDQTALIGGDIKKLAGTSNYQLYLESDGDSPDQSIGDGEAVRLDGRVCHFFVVPPATPSPYGRF